ncbi:hypothetical protein [Sphingomonas faeni]|uniref:hypothetical protein n=1 Tax=Sphingomonas faeni TaxID=185950 RepID=UPI00335F7726
MSRLTLRYRYDASFFDPKLDRDDFGRLSVVVETDKFSGRGGFWVQWQDVREFAEALAVFPIVSGSPIVGQWGYNMQEGDDLVLRFEIASANKRGDLLVTFVVADEHHRGSRVSGSFLTNYPDIEAFRLGIGYMMESEVEEAVLEGHNLP